MLNILDRYEQVSFNTTVDTIKYVGTCNLKDNKIVSINVQFYSGDESYYRGNMNINDLQGVSISLVSSLDVSKMSEYTEVLNNIKEELENTLIKA